MKSKQNAKETCFSAYIFPLFKKKNKTSHILPVSSYVHFALKSRETLYFKR